MLVATALQAGGGGFLAAVPSWRVSIAPFLRLVPPLLAGFFFARWTKGAGKDPFRRLAGGALAGGLGTLAGTLLALPLGSALPSPVVVVVSAAGAGILAGLAGALAGSL